MSLTRQIRGARRSSEGLPFEISLDSFEGSEKKLRTEDKVITKAYNEKSNALGR